MAGAVKRATVDLGGYPDLVVVYLGMRVNLLSGAEDAVGVRTKNTERRESCARGSAAARESNHFALSSPRGHASILARFSIVGSLGSFGATPRLVEAIST